MKKYVNYGTTCMHNKFVDGVERWYVYDKNINPDHYTDFWKYKTWYEYDKNGNLTHSKTYDDFECWYEYNKNNSRIHYKNSNGGEVYYDNKRNEITKKQYIINVLIKWKQESEKDSSMLKKFWKNYFNM